MKSKYYVEKRVVNWKPIILLAGTFLWIILFHTYTILLSETTPIPLSAFYMIVAFFMFYMFIDELNENDWTKRKRVYVTKDKVKG